MKTTIEIADDLFHRAQEVAREREITFRSLTEQGLRLILDQKQRDYSQWKWKPVIVKRGGLTKQFKNASWETIRDEIYNERGK
jgi:hypothetical protein